LLLLKSLSRINNEVDTHVGFSEAAISDVGSTPTASTTFLQ